MLGPACDEAFVAVIGIIMNTCNDTLDSVETAAVGLKDRSWLKDLGPGMYAFRMDRAEMIQFWVF